MREDRSVSQILFGYLPEQTVDLRGRVWKVRSWELPLREPVDDASLRRELRRQVHPWERAGQDGGFTRDLFAGKDVDVLTLNRTAGVRVDEFPKAWFCKHCGRIGETADRRCRCGEKRWAQFHFVGYHSCGALRPPWFPRCPQHNDVKVIFPGTASAAEIRFVCHTCNRQLRRGFGMPNCSCGNGRVTFTVHRAASVYTPRTVVIVNPPRSAEVETLKAAGGAARALDWVLDDMPTRTVVNTGPTRQSLFDQLVAQGMDEAFAGRMADEAVKEGQVTPDPQRRDDDLGPSEAAAAEEAVNIALATVESRIQVSDLSAVASGAQKDKYDVDYAHALEHAGITAVDLVDRFPVLTGNFGYTRGESTPGASRLVPFRSARGRYAVYADIAETEALLVRLDPLKVAAFLEQRGFKLGAWRDARSSRAAIIRNAVVPAPGDEPARPTVGSELLRLIHSYAHRFIRRLSVFAGVERASLAEMLVPLHLSFFVYAAGRGDFVLGGLQAVFENDLDLLLRDFVDAEHRCALDPGCSATGAACMACLHLGEPSCRYFNRFLARPYLHGPDGYLP